MVQSRATLCQMLHEGSAVDLLADDLTLETGNKKGEKDVVLLTGQGVAADGMTFLQYKGDFSISLSG